MDKVFLFFFFSSRAEQQVSSCFSVLTGRHLTMLPVEPKLGKMLLLGAIFNCLDPILTIVSGLSVRDPFLTPFDKKDVCQILTLLCFYKKSLFFGVLGGKGWKA